MTSEKIAGLIEAMFKFRHKHPAISVTISVLMTAACAGGMYLLITKFPLLKLSCFTGGCN